MARGFIVVSDFGGFELFNVTYSLLKVFLVDGFGKIWKNAGLAE